MKQNLNLNIQLTQRQELRLSQELIQSIELLQLNQMELRSFIQEELTKNPTLEIEYKDSSESLEEALDESQDQDEYLQELESYGYSNRSTVQYQSEEEYSFLDYATVETSLDEILLEQLKTEDLEDIQDDIGEYLISLLDKNGFLSRTLEEITEDIPLPAEELLEVLEIIQTFEPSGIGARNLEECLLIQAKEYQDPLLNDMIENHLEDIGANRLNKIAKDCKISMDEVVKKVEIIKSFNPKPAASYYQGEITSFIVPEARVEKVEEEYQITMLNDDLPSLFISEDYINMYKESSDETKGYLNKNISAAQWIIDSIRQRQETIKKIIEEIVKNQKKFFEEGPKRLRPMSQKEMADLVDVHESTVSRAISDKYIETPQGVLELSFFFGQTIAKSNGEEFSSTAIKSFLQEIVDQEDKSSPLSDEALRVELKAHGIKISRRTVAKYRDELEIPNSLGRKEFL